ncbi:MAG: hypothetical protein LBR60_07460 [Fibrobacter sp.]|nr:hypothetical protein [Fibrobacter sp.]
MKKSALLFCFLLLLLTACDGEHSGTSAWLKDQGYPMNYEVRTLLIDGLSPVSVEVGFDSIPRKQAFQGVLGNVSSVNHDLVFDIGFRDSAFFDRFGKADSAASLFALYLDTNFYQQTGFDSLPLNEDLELNFSWILSSGEGKGFIDSVGKIRDSVWLRELLSWDNAESFDTVYSLSIVKLDSAVRLDLPSALTERLTELKDGCRLQLRLSAKNSKRLFRFTGPESLHYPLLRMRVTDTDFKTVVPFRMAIVSSKEESCTDCPVLHGGILDSMVVTLPGKDILKALSGFYGDSFPNPAGDGMDVRQAVVMAQLLMQKDGSVEGSELGFPVQVAVASISYHDEKDDYAQTSEAYKLNPDLVEKSGHPNLVFWPGDTLALQVTSGVRSFVNNAANETEDFRVVLRLGYSVLAPNDTLYYNHVNSDGDSVKIFLNHLTYSRYDFSKSVDNPMRLKLWLASKRGEQ